jgi:hypothetical protein
VLEEEGEDECGDIYTHKIRPSMSLMPHLKFKRAVVTLVHSLLTIGMRYFLLSLLGLSLLFCTARGEYGSFTALSMVMSSQALSAISITTGAFTNRCVLSRSTGRIVRCRSRTIVS